ncbi:RNA methyltransferase [Mesobacillus subterraneus]|uniref:RNA methyltransferase n=2 Tax=Mesobacillus subterraneus TaxID=285983 RepID=A0A427TRA0_9BACI|nr:RsmD family RNA methyltransferase [Mesobacillus subterraneus]RSD26923.1 RNA methyltransferase [Mesobacillus subterraneus]
MLEMRSFFGKDSETGVIESMINIDPSRSPFIRERIDVIIEGADINDIIAKVKELQLEGATFKVIFVKDAGDEKWAFADRRRIEREVGLAVPGQPELDQPDLLFGFLKVNGRWVFGLYHSSEAIWLHHQQKPHSYSTALSTRVARAVANIAVPNPAGVKAIDPCCGIGTVVVEALSMGIGIVGSDNNPLILAGTRENIAHFGYETEIKYMDLRDVTGEYNVAIIDMPYNLCSVITAEEQLEMLERTRKFAEKLVIVTIEPIDPVIVEAGFEIVDRGVVRKGNFIREVIVCRRNS